MGIWIHFILTGVRFLHEKGFWHDLIFDTLQVKLLYDKLLYARRDEWRTMNHLLITE